MTNESDALNTVVAIAALHTIASGFTVPEAYREAARKAVTVLQDLANDRDEWKQQHENLLGVKEQDSAALEAEVERLRERERLLIAKIADPETGLYRERADLQDAAIAATERAQAAEQALRALWALWNDKEWLQRRYDYERGHLSYANQLNEVERPIRAALAALQGEP